MTNEELDNARAEEAWNIYNREHSGDVSAIAARLAREGWTPPVAVDPDIAEAEKLWELWGHSKGNYLALKAIKRGRALANAEAKPEGSRTAAFQAGSAGYRDWQDITHYAIITPPEEDAA